MSHWFEIERAAADRRAADLQAGKDAQLLRAAREERIIERRWNRLAARIRRLITARLHESPSIAPADATELPGDAPATIR
jgi:hypothetical protein